MRRQFEHKRKIIDYLHSIMKSASSSKDDEVNTLMDLAMLTFEFMDEGERQKILDAIGKEYKMMPPTIYHIEELPF
jgi:hypothetical protein